MSIVTKKGDLGRTTLASGETISKADERVEAYGTLDEFVSSLGLAKNFLSDSEDAEVVNRLQGYLFVLGTELAKGKKPARISKEQLNFVEKYISKIEKSLPRQTKFIVPGDSIPSGFLHTARTICRRLERKVIKLVELGEFDNPIALKFINRASDLVYLMARKATACDQIAIFSTAPSEEEAVKIVEHLVAGNLIACGNIVPEIRSIYRWKGKVCDETEVLIVMKSVAKNLENIKKEVKALHSYDCPELVAVPITGGLKNYLDWIVENL